MVYATSVPVTRLVFSEGFNYYGAGTSLSASATVNLSVADTRHEETGETLTDGGRVPAQAVAEFDVPRVSPRGWRAPDGSTLSGWFYDLALIITATGQPTLLWTATISPHSAQEVITPGMGIFTGGATDGGGSIVVTEDPNVPGTAVIGA